MIALVGYTGFVGCNIYAKASNRIDTLYNSKNIKKAYGLEPDILIYSGLRAEKYLANNAPDKDMELILEAEENIRKIAPKKLVLISTIDVFKNPVGVDENTLVPLASGNGFHPYGLNRYYLEAWVRKNYPDALIIRLPGLYGLNLKKNFIYDMINIIPFMIKTEKMEELSAKDNTEPKFLDCYELLDNGFYRCKKLSEADKYALKAKFQKIGFTALGFTDSRSTYQFYPLNRLWEDIHTALNEDIRTLHLATEPVSAGELYKYVTGKEFKNELKGTPAKYDYKTIYAEKFGGKGGYICSKQEILADIKGFMEGHGY